MRATNRACYSIPNFAFLLVAKGLLYQLQRHLERINWTQYRTLGQRLKWATTLIGRCLQRTCTQVPTLPQLKRNKLAACCQTLLFFSLLSYCLHFWEKVAAWNKTFCGKDWAVENIGKNRDGQIKIRRRIHALFHIVCLPRTRLLFFVIPWSLLDGQKQAHLGVTIQTRHHFSSTDQNRQSYIEKIDLAKNLVFLAKL